MKSPELFLTIREVAAILSRPPDWIWRRVSDRKLKSVKSKGRHLISIRDLRKYVAMNSNAIPQLRVFVYFEDAGAFHAARIARDVNLDFLAEAIEGGAESLTELKR